MLHNHRIITRQFFSALIFLSASVSLIFSESETVIQKHILSQIEYISDNITRESALKRELDINKDKSFETREDLEKYIADKGQDLINLRVLDSVDWSVEVINRDETASYYKAAFEVKSSWTIYPIPYPKYDSNSGFRLGMKVYYDNFLGTLTNLYLGTNIDIRNDDDEWVIPQWSLNPKLSHIKALGQIFSFEIMQQYQELTKYDGEEYDQYYTYHRTKLSLSTSILLPYDFSYSLSPSFTFFYGYDDQLEDNGSDIQKDDTDFTFSHGLSYSNLDWTGRTGNFRKGFAASIENTLSLVTENQIETSVENVEDTELESGEFRSSLSGYIKGFIPWFIFNPSAKVSGFYNFNEESVDMGEKLRGIRDDAMYGDRGAFLNTSLNISVIPWTGVGEALFQPFFDIGFAAKENEDINWDDDLKYSTGADFILYLDKLKSLVARGSIGIDLTIPDWNDSRKIEIDITSSLAY